MVCTLNFHVMSRQGCVQIIMFWSVIVMVFVQKMALLYLINFVTSNLSFVSVTNLLVPALLVIKLFSKGCLAGLKWMLSFVGSGSSNALQLFKIDRISCDSITLILYSQLLDVPRGGAA
jgi:hypothetical protein